MAAPVPVTITARFPVLGVELSTESGGIVGYELDSDYTTPTDGWSLDIYSDDGIQYKHGWECQPVEILINGIRQVIGRVDITEYGAGEGTVLRLEGRDYLAELVECHADPALRVAKDMTLGDALLLAFGPVGIDGIVDNDDALMSNVLSGSSVSTPTGRPHKDLKVGDLKAEPGQGLFDWGNRLVARHGATMQPGTSRRQVVLSSPNFGQSPAWAISRRITNPGARANNVLRASARSNYGTFPTFVLATGKQRTGGAETSTAAAASQLVSGDVDPEDLTQFAARFPPGFDDAALIHTGRIKPTDGPKSGEALYRFHHVRDDQAKDGEEVARIRLRHAAERLKDTLTYEIELHGHADPNTGALYAIDTVVEVDDEICNVRERLWVSSRTFFDQGQGPRTKLRCIRLGTYVI